MNVGIVGCGVISRHYAQNARAFDSFEIVACADVDLSAAESLAAEHDLPVATVDELIADPAIDIVLNLTPPAVHVAVIRKALAAGKHVYSEKPLATTSAEAAELVALAGEHGLRLACAPDVFLGGAYQAARGLLDEGAIGEPLSVSAAMLVGSQATWHPNPDIFFADGAGPLLDMGPYYLSTIVALLGPVDRSARRGAVRGGDADAHGRATRARRWRDGESRRELRGARTLRMRLRGPWLGRRARAPGPERVRRAGAHAPPPRGVARRSVRVTRGPRRARHRSARSRRSHRGGSTTSRVGRACASRRRRRPDHPRRRRRRPHDRGHDDDRTSRADAGRNTADPRLKKPRAFVRSFMPTPRTWRRP